MARILSCKINVGDYAFRSCNKAIVNSSRTSFGDSAELVLPLRGIIKNDQKKPIALDKYITESMPLTIDLGFDGINNRRFQGYVKSVAIEDSITLTCEDEVYNLKRANAINKTFQNISLKNLLKSFKADVQLSDSVPDMLIEEFFCHNATPAEALQQIKDLYHLDIYFRAGKLYAGMPYADVAAPTTRLLLRSDPVSKEICNIEKNNLKYLTSETNKIRIKVVSMLPDNSKITVDGIGDIDGELRTLYYYNIRDKDQLRKLGEGQLSVYKVAGYKGSVTTFGLPVLYHSQSVQVVDPRFIDQKGNYITDGVIDRFDDSGYECVAKIGQKL